MYMDLAASKIAIPFYSNMRCQTLGLDHWDHCLDSVHFGNHSAIWYEFNSLGYRTHKVEQFQPNAILTLGDSFTLGLGNHADQRFTDIIQRTLRHQVLNFSLNGASNDWICRKLSQLLPFFQPKAIIIHYTFSHRRERPQSDWHDDERTECEPTYSSDQNYSNWFDNFSKIQTLAGGIKCVHSFIHNWHDCVVDYHDLGQNVLPPQPQLDFARDGFHYGPATHQLLADKITSLLAA